MRAFGNLTLIWMVAFLFGLIAPSEKAIGADLDLQRVVGSEAFESVLDIGAPGKFDQRYVLSPSVLFDGTTYRMWYAAKDIPVPGEAGIGLATSSDGVNWTRANGGDPVLNLGAAGKFDSAQLVGPEVVYDDSDNLFKMWYGGMSGSTNGAVNIERIGLATSPDGINWTRANGGNPVLDIGFGAYDSVQVANASVVREGTGFRMWYSAYSNETDHTLGAAVSTDGITWTRENAGLPVNGLPTTFAEGPSIAKYGDEYVMLYTGHDAGESWEMHAATSIDGIDWQILNDGNPILPPGSGDVFDLGSASEPTILLQNSVLKVWYSGVRPDSGGVAIRSGLAQASVPLASDREWNTDSLGDWNAATNWVLNVSPGTNTHTAIFADAITASRTVFTNAAVAIKGITFGDSDATTTQQSYAIGGQGSINLDSDTNVSTISVLEGSHQFQAVVNLVNPTNVAMAAGTSLTFGNTLNLNGNILTKSGAGTMRINNRLIAGGSSVVIAAGALGGSGEIDGDLTNTGGKLAPGNSPGKFKISGNYTHGPGATLSIEIAGRTQGDKYDLLDITGEVTINGGVLEVALFEGFNPAMGDTFDVLDFGSMHGIGFDSLSLPALASGLGWDTSQLLTDGTLEVTTVPEPSAIVLILIGSLCTRKTVLQRRPRVPATAREGSTDIRFSDGSRDY